MPKVEHAIDENRAAKVEWDSYGCHLLTLNNGHQWSGAAIYSVEVAKAAVGVLQEYINRKSLEAQDAED